MLPSIPLRRHTVRSGRHHASSPRRHECREPLAARPRHRGRARAMSTRAAAIVLAGGGSTRMGTDKASLDWHGTTLLRRAVGIAHRAVDGPVIVVRAAGQRLPLLPDGVELAQDARPDRGPLEGLAAGLDTLGD